MLRVSGAMPPDPVTSSLREQLLAAKQARAELAAQFMAEHPRVKAATQQVADLEKALIAGERRCVEAYALAYKQRGEAAHSLGVAGELGGQQLERDLAPEPRIFGQIDLAHPTRAEWREYLV